MPAHAGHVRTFAFMCQGQGSPGPVQRRWRQLNRIRCGNKQNINHRFRGMVSRIFADDLTFEMMCVMGVVTGRNNKWPDFGSEARVHCMKFMINARPDGILCTAILSNKMLQYICAAFSRTAHSRTQTLEQIADVDVAAVCTFANPLAQASGFLSHRRAPAFGAERNRGVMNSFSFVPHSASSPTRVRMNHFHPHPPWTASLVATRGWLWAPDA